MRQSLLGIYYEAGLYSSWPTVLIVAPVELDMEMLPSYSPEVLPGYELTPTASITSSSGPRSSLSPSHSSYVYRSARMELDLGPQRWGTRLPAYGRGGMVQGTVAVRTFRHVDKVVVRSHMIVNKTIDCGLQRLRLLLVQRRETASRFFVLEGDDEAARPIPASGSTQLTRAQASVAYVVRSSNRDPVYSSHNQPLLPPFMPELGNEKRPQISESEWHSDDLLLERSRTSSEPSAGYKSEAGSSSGSTVEKIPRLWVPRDLRYPSGKCIPFMLSLPTARADSASDIESGIEVQLVRVSTIQTRAAAWFSKQVPCLEDAFSRAVIKDGLELCGVRSILVVLGKTSAGTLSRSYLTLYVMLVSALFSLARINASPYSLIKGVELTTHEWSGERAGRIPSLDSPVTSRTGAHIVRVNF
ncbi:hypothetical protein RHS01_08207 [Rhizoctonia solani]|uniref:Uncharacterized protein n=1 Tax=Rhizoctonia solani TaxID=456999 RepID=A0A8H7I649_9AGAM|nr:hypothetical protein RHS01_08207 [Rhizoctonia solani]